MAGAVWFVFQGKVRTLRDIDPNMTVLDWLREHERKTGTKEGCAEGDCGACTVVLGELANDGPMRGTLRYRAVNACILFMPVLDGKELVVVEDLRGPDGALHPVQQALVDTHGSQCGFCTPGFVMSLFALYHSDPAPGRAAINDAIAGNLCRCTGYRPIIDAGLVMHGYGRTDRFDKRAKATVKLLKSIARDETLELEAPARSNGRRYFAPVSEDALADLVVAHPTACLLAGGTDVGLWVTKQHRDLDTLIYLGGVRDMTYVRESETEIEIGAAASYSDAFEAVGGAYPDLAELFRRLGSMQIRNAGTVGGNIANASPIGDSAPGLIALGASLVLRRGGRVRELPLDEFFVDYRKTALQQGEYLSAIRVPRPRSGRHFHTYKVSKRFDQDISAVCGAYCVSIEGGRVREARIAYGGMAATSKRAVACEAALEGGEWSAGTVAQAMRALEKDFTPMSDMRASADYRMMVAKNLLQRMYLETAVPARAAMPLQVLAYAR
ncbi:MAG TPA: xanthine dehydrogenase small subunit [Alphaproteobacteria bacterium]|nr:xanthine dehydrogenase small subunit [Alphaproteobacteria bacterium]